MLKFKKQFQGVPDGEIYPRTYEPGEACPPELESGARSLDAVEEVDGETAVPRTRKELDGALAALPGNQTDPDYVVNGMRGYFADLFTADDEAKVRDLVKPPVRKPSDGLTVEELKAALVAQGVEIPEGVKLKADLAALLDSKV